MNKLCGWLTPLLAFLLLILSHSPDALAKQQQEIRFYKVNKDGISQRIRFTTRKSRQAGCHNLRFKKGRLHKVSHFGFAYCEVYAKKNCEPESIMPFQHDKVEGTTTRLSQGYGWIPVGEHARGEKMKSWQCVEQEKAD